MALLRQLVRCCTFIQSIKKFFSWEGWLWSKKERDRESDGKITRFLGKYKRPVPLSRRRRRARDETTEMQTIAEEVRDHFSYHTLVFAANIQ